MSRYTVPIPADKITQISGDVGELIDRFACCEHLRSLSVTRFKDRLGKLDRTVGAQIEDAIMRALQLPC